MQRLKKMLSLVITVAMLLSFGAMGFSAGALSEDFSDANLIADIHKTAIDVLTELGIITGIDDNGKLIFDPTRPIKRVEFCTIIAKALNGGKTPMLDESAKPNFADCPDGYWGNPYIFYCVELGLVAGDGGTPNYFRPEDPITVVEAAKVILVAAGYRADVAGFIGAGWATNVATSANNCDPKLFDGIDSNLTLSSILDRQNAAEMLNNGIRTGMKRYQDGLVSDGKGGFTTRPSLVDFTHQVSGTDVVHTILEYYFGVTSVVGVVTANEYASLDTGSSLKKGTSTIKGTTYEVSTDESLLGVEVEIFTKRVDNKNMVYGKAIPTDNNTIVTVPYDKTITTYASQNGVSITANQAVIKNYNGEWNKKTVGDVTTVGTYAEYIASVMAKSGTNANVKPENAKAPSGITIRLIDNNGDGKADYFIALEPEIDRIVNITGEGKVEFGAVPSVEKSALITDLTLARNDIVSVLWLGNNDKAIVEPVKTVQTVVTFNLDGDKSVEVEGDLAKINVSDLVSYLPTSSYTKTAGNLLVGAAAKSEYLFYLDKDNNAFAYKEVEAVAGKYILVTEVSEPTGGFSDESSYRIRGYLADGTALKTYNVHVDSKDADAITDDADGIEWKDAFASLLAQDATFKKGASPVLCRYTVRSDGTVTLYDPLIVFDDNSVKYGADISENASSINGTTNGKEFYALNTDNDTVRLGSDTVTFYLSYKGTPGNFTELKFEYVKTSARFAAKIDDAKRAAVIAGLTDGKTVPYARALVVATEGSLTPGTVKYAYIAHNKIGDNGDEFQWKILSYDDGAVEALTVKSEEDLSGYAGEFVTYYINADGYFEIDETSADFHPDDAIALEGVVITDVSTRGNTLVTFDNGEIATLPSSTTVHRYNVNQNGFLTTGATEYATAKFVKKNADNTYTLTNDETVHYAGEASYKENDVDNAPVAAYVAALIVDGEIVIMLSNIPSNATFYTKQP